MTRIDELVLEGWAIKSIDVTFVCSNEELVALASQCYRRHSAHHWALQSASISKFKDKSITYCVFWNVNSQFFLLILCPMLSICTSPSPVPIIREASSTRQREVMPKLNLSLSGKTNCTKAELIRTAKMSPDVVAQKSNSSWLLGYSHRRTTNKCNILVCKIMVNQVNFFSGFLASLTNKKALSPGVSLNFSINKSRVACPRGWLCSTNRPVLQGS